MPDSNVEIVRRGFRAFDTLDIDAFVADWDPDVVWDVSGYEGWPGDRVLYRGVPEILAQFAEFHRGSQGLSVDVHEVRALDDRRVLAIYTETSRDPATNARTITDIGIIHTFESGRIVRMEVHTGHRAARRAAGLE